VPRAAEPREDRELVGAGVGAAVVDGEQPAVQIDDRLVIAGGADVRLDGGQLLPAVLAGLGLWSDT
jgi:hypothetical protein